MKKVLSVFLMTALLMLSLCACKGGDKPYTSSTATDITSSQIQQMIRDAQNEQNQAGK